MAIASMTGFARYESPSDADAPERAPAARTWEVKSVNSRGLDVRCRLPAGYDRLELEIRRRAQAAFVRGSLQISVALDRQQRARALRVNHDWLQVLLAERERLGDAVAAGPPQFEALMALRGVIEEDEALAADEDSEALEAALLADTDALFADLGRVRAEEGMRLETTLRAHIVQIEALVALAEGSAASQPDAIKTRLSLVVEQLLADRPELSAERLAQEVAMLAAKADVREELDRLTGHVAAARDLLDAGGAVGRRLDFLCQEFNREANTLCAKSSDLSLTEVGLAVKSTIDQLREQVQNVE